MSYPHRNLVDARTEEKIKAVKLARLLTTPITSDAQARAYLKSLLDLGYLYHPEDATDTIINTYTGGRLFSDVECVLADERMTEVRMCITDDVCEVALGLFVESIE